jgi:tRNA-splicing ligase RtcB (3'-phosphate/5'-hydroxy nucleic acid ligase)
MLRIDPYRVLVGDAHPVELFANESVFIDRQSIIEIAAFATVTETIAKLVDVGFLDRSALIERIILTPDFHKGAGIPIGTVFRSRGFVMPRAVGSDIGCGMRFITTDVTREEFDSLGNRLDRRLRYIFFEGGRNIPLSREQREAIFLDGLSGLVLTEHSDEGIWSFWDDRAQMADVDHLHSGGGFPTKSLHDFSDFIRGYERNHYTRDDQIGSIGGGNHFAEFQVVEEVFDRQKAYEWGIKTGMMAIMAHSGSLGIGHIVGNHFTDHARSIYPKGLRHDHDFYVLPEDRADTYLDAMRNAANFAFANRLFLGLMMVRALSECLKRPVQHRVVYDAPHNLVWSDDGTFLHRKGACPADQEEPVIIPGSMGSSSFILAGHGNLDSLCSACHGAGRSKPRQQGRKGAKPNPCRVVTKINPALVRRDIREEYEKALAEEAPDRYKEIDPIIDTVEGAGIAWKVARTYPLLTVKGL